MRKPIIAMKVSQRMYDALIALGNAVIVALTGNGNFTVPAVSLVNLQAAVTAVENALALWRNAVPGNRGSSDDLADLRAKATLLWQLLRAESQYVATTAQIAAGNDYPTMRAVMMTSGFPLANDPTPQGVLEMVQGFHRFDSRQVNPNAVKLKWSKPLNVTSKGNVKAYRVLKSGTGDLSTAVEIADTTRTTYTDVNNTPALVTWTYWVIAVNSAGAGTVSDPITVKLPPA